MSKRATRRDFLTGASALGAASLFGIPETASAEPPPETDTIRLTFEPGFPILFWAPQYVAEQFLYLEGFKRVHYAPFLRGGPVQTLHRGEADIAAENIAGWVGQIDRGAAAVVLSGMHAGCFEVVANKPITSIRELKGKRIAANAEGTGAQLLMASVAAYIGIDPRHEISWVYANPNDWVRLLTEEQVDAIGMFPPMSYAVRDGRIGNLILNTTTDKPWRDYFCCMVGANREFVERYPVATKRALRAILKANELCNREPQSTATWLGKRGVAPDYADVERTLRDVQFGAWREYSPADTLRFFGLRLYDVGLIKNHPNELLAKGTDWRFLNELKKELKA